MLAPSRLRIFRVIPVGRSRRPLLRMLVVLLAVGGNAVRPDLAVGVTGQGDEHRRPPRLAIWRGEHLSRRAAGDRFARQVGGVLAAPRRPGSSAPRLLPAAVAMPGWGDATTDIGGADPLVQLADELVERPCVGVPGESVAAARLSLGSQYQPAFLYLIGYRRGRCPGASLRGTAAPAATSPVVRRRGICPPSWIRMGSEPRRIGRSECLCGGAGRAGYSRLLLRRAVGPRSWPGASPVAEPASARSSGKACRRLPGDRPAAQPTLLMHRGTVSAVGGVEARAADRARVVGPPRHRADRAIDARSPARPARAPAHTGGT
jgi:hypothetical protein